VVCYRSSGTTYPLKIKIKTIVDDDNDDNDDMTKLCPRKTVIGNILMLVKSSLKFCYEICKKL